MRRRREALDVALSLRALCKSKNLTCTTALSPVWHQAIASGLHERPADKADWTHLFTHHMGVVQITLITAALPG